MTINNIIICALLLGASVTASAEKTTYIAVGCGTIIEASNVATGMESFKKPDSLNGIEAAGILGGMTTAAIVAGSAVINIGNDALNANKTYDPNMPGEVIFKPDVNDQFKVIFTNTTSSNAIEVGSRAMILVNKIALSKAIEPGDIILANLSVLPNKGADLSCNGLINNEGNLVNIEATADTNKIGSIKIIPITKLERNKAVDAKRDPKTEAITALYRKLWVHDGVVDYAAIHAYADKAAAKVTNPEGRTPAEVREAMYQRFVGYVEKKPTETHR